MGFVRDFDKTIKSHISSEPDRRQTVSEFPFYTDGNYWETLSSSGWDDWISGFWPGILWMATAVDDQYQEQASYHTKKVQPKYSDNFNVGFRNQYSWLTGYEVTQNDEYRDMATSAVDRLLNCFHAGTGLIGHRKNGRIYVSATDAMMNLPLLIWSYYRNYKPVRCRWVIEQTLNSSMDYFIRPDNGVNHLLQFDRRRNKLLSIQSPQGYPGGCWARGLAWMTTGLVTAGIAFNRQDCLEQAQDLMLYHWRNSRDVIPPYDYGDNRDDTRVPPDTSAGAILASGILLLAEHDNDERLRKSGHSIVNDLYNQFERTDNEDGLIGGSSFHVPKEYGVDEATIWGDFYALESLYLSEKETLPPHLNWLNVA